MAALMGVKGRTGRPRLCCGWQRCVCVYLCVLPA